MAEESGKDQYILQVKNLGMVYPNGTRALKGVSLNVRSGEFLVIVGLSGSGKSTLLRCINKLHDPTSGEIFFKGKEVSQIKGEETRLLRKKIGMIFQQFNLIPRQTVFKNVLMGNLGHTSTLRSLFGFFSLEDKSRSMRALELVGIENKAQMRADNLSGGQQQRVAIARALAQSPDILLADEPVASLDPATCHVVMDHLKKINSDLGITVIANLHFLSLVRQYATRVIALRAGEIVYEGAPNDISEEWFKKIYGESAKEVYVN